MYPFLRLGAREVVKRDDGIEAPSRCNGRGIKKKKKKKKEKDRKRCIIKKVAGEGGKSSYNKLFPGPISQTCYHHRLFLIPPPRPFRYSRHPI